MKFKNNEMKIILKTTTYLKKKNTKTVWLKEEVETEKITEEAYDNMVNPKTLSAYRNLGGSETTTKSYTHRGFKITRLISTSPNREIKIIRQFKF